MKIITLIMLCCTGPLWGLVNLSNFSINSSTNIITFDIAGTIDAGASIGTVDSHVMYIGVPGDNDWIVSATSSGSVVNNGGASRDFNTGLQKTQTFLSGDYIELVSSDFATWAIGDSVNASVTLTGGDMVAENLVINDLIVTAGYFSDYSTFPDPRTSIGAVVPEPGTYALIIGTLMGLFVWRRRR